MSDVIDLTAMVEQHFADPDERGDEARPHVSDLADCDRATWARRNGQELLTHSTASRMKFALGNATEDTIAKALQSKMLEGWELERNVRVALRLDGDELHGRILPEGEDPQDSEIVGHVDYVLRNPTTGGVTVVEVKSTTFFPRRNPANGKMERLIPAEAQYHYRLQAAAYAHAVGAAAFAILVVCRDSGLMTEFWYPTKAYTPELAMRAGQVLSRTGPGAPMPAAEPPVYAEGKKGNWRCMYCRFASCEKNINQQAMVV